MKTQARLRLRKPIMPVYTPSGTPVVCSCGGLIMASFSRPHWTWPTQTQNDMIYQCIHCDRSYVRA